MASSPPAVRTSSRAPGGCDEPGGQQSPECRRQRGLPVHPPSQTIACPQSRTRIEPEPPQQLVSELGIGEYVCDERPHGCSQATLGSSALDGCCRSSSRRWKVSSPSRNSRPTRTAQSGRPFTVVLHPDVVGQVDQVADLGRRLLDQRQQAATPQVDGHVRVPPSCGGGRPASWRNQRICR